MSSSPVIPERGTVDVQDRTVSTLLLRPDDARALLVLGHGSGTDMEHGFMNGVAGALAERGIATLRYNFPYSEIGGRPPDRKPVLVTTIARVMRAAAERADGLPLFLGGKSMGGRMASHAVVEAQVTGAVRGLVFIGFPLHRPRDPGIARAEHLGAVDVPMLFVQGTRDAMAESSCVDQVMAALGDRAHLHRIVDADHGFAVLKRTGMTEADVFADIAGAVSDFVDGVIR